jgi:hypothetical protein
MEDFCNSLQGVFGYLELTSQVMQDNLSLNEPVILLQMWDSNDVLHSACNNFIQGAKDCAVKVVQFIFQPSILQDMILYQERVCF